MNIREILSYRPKPEPYSPRKHDDFLHSRVCVQDKLDGWRVTIFRTDEVQIIGRKYYVNLWDLLKHTPMAEAVLALPKGTVLDGEYHGGIGVTGTDVPTMMRDGTGTFTPWAMPYLNGDCYLNRSILYINEHLDVLGWTAPKTTFLQVATVNHLIHDAEDKGLEGYVLKLAQWEGWIKVKPTKTYDLIVTDVVRGGVRGSIKSLVVSTREGIEIGKVGGLTDETREGDHIGRVVEVRAQDITKDGKLKFARLVRFRDDKDEVDSIGDIS